MESKIGTVRIHTYDLLRGWYLIAITADHLLRFPSIFDPLFGRGLLWVTAAEGFFFISGAMICVARRKLLEREGFRVAAKRIWERAFKLYVASIVITLAFSGLAYWLTAQQVAHIKPGLVAFSSIGELVWQTATLRYVYGWTDFLNFYAVYLLLSPFVLWLLSKRQWWFIAGLCCAVWVFKRSIDWPFSIDYLIWQAYFFLGMVFGYHFNDLRAGYRRIPLRAARVLRWCVFGLTASTILASLVFVFGDEFLKHFGSAANGLLVATHLPPASRIETWLEATKASELYDILLNYRQGLLRLPLFLCWFATFFYLVRRYESSIIRRAGGLLQPLGKNSLYVYICSGVLAFVVPLMSIPQGLFVNTIIIVLAVGILWLAVYKRFLFWLIPR